MLARSVAVAAVAWGGSGWSAAFAATADPVPEGDAWLAAFLTGKGDVPPEIVQRGFAALRGADPAADGRLATLAARIRAARLADVEAFRASPLARDPALMATATEVIRAFYLGRVGKGAAARFVAYRDALMYRPTADVTVVPTYSLRQPDYWVTVPRP